MVHTYPGIMAPSTGSGLGSWLSGPDASDPGKYPGERLGMPHCSSHFAFETANCDGQFKLFLQLVAWLLKEARADAEFEIEEYDDPNTSVTKMMLALKSTGFTMEVSAMKLKQAGSKIQNAMFVRSLEPDLSKN